MQFDNQIVRHDPGFRLAIRCRQCGGIDVMVATLEAYGQPNSGDFICRMCKAKHVCVAPGQWYQQQVHYVQYAYYRHFGNWRYVLECTRCNSRFASNGGFFHVC